MILTRTDPPFLIEGWKTWFSCLTLTFNPIKARVRVTLHAKYKGCWPHSFVMRAHTDRQTNTHTVPIILPLPLTREVMSNDTFSYYKSGIYYRPQSERDNALGNVRLSVRLRSHGWTVLPTTFICCMGADLNPHAKDEGRRSNETVQLWERKQTDGQTDGRTDRRYQVNYFPRFALDKNCSSVYMTCDPWRTYLWFTILDIIYQPSCPCATPPG